MKSFNLLYTVPIKGDGPERFYIDGKAVGRDEYRRLGDYAVRSDCLSTALRGDRWHHSKVVYL